MKTTNLQIIYTGNDKMFTGLYLSILSILRRTESNIDFYVLTGDLTSINPQYKALSKRHANILNCLIKKYNINSNFYVIDCSSIYKRKLKFNKISMRKWTPYTLFRLLIDKFDFNDIVLYLDVDMLISGDIKEAFDVNMSNYELCVCHDWNKRFRNHKTFFNAGSLLINVEYCKKTRLFEKSFLYCLENDPPQLDQTALNKCWTKIKFWKNEYRFNNQPFNFAPNAIINHFYGAWPLVKPWDIMNFIRVQTKLKRFYWGEDYRIYIRAQKNKFKD